jgi:hypothetical protein
MFAWLAEKLEALFAPAANDYAAAGRFAPADDPLEFDYRMRLLGLNDCSYHLHSNVMPGDKDR